MLQTDGDNLSQFVMFIKIVQTT